MKNETMNIKLCDAFYEGPFFVMYVKMIQKFLYKNQRLTFLS